MIVHACQLQNWPLILPANYSTGNLCLCAAARAQTSRACKPTVTLPLLLSSNGPSYLAWSSHTHTPHGTWVQAGAYVCWPNYFQLLHLQPAVTGYCYSHLDLASHHPCCELTNQPFPPTLHAASPVAAIPHHCTALGTKRPDRETARQGSEVGGTGLSAAAHQQQQLSAAAYLFTY